MKQLITLVIIALLSASAQAEPELKGGPEELRQFLHPSDRLVSIFADAEETAYSDIAIVSLVISVEDKKLSDALAKNAQLRESINNRLLDFGISSDAIRSSKFSTSPQFGWFGKKPASYKVVNRISVRISDEKYLQKIAEIADASDDIELADTSFEHSEKEKLEQQVKSKALAKVMKQRKFYEQQLGVSLVPVGFRQSDIGLRATRGAMVLEEVVVTARKRSSSLAEAPEAMAPAAAGNESSFDEVKYKAGIYVDFRIELPDK